MIKTNEILSEPKRMLEGGVRDRSLYRCNNGFITLSDIWEELPVF